jgi:tetratricopeptide (TPR) repeat protein/tRNA A-37 threonylcarbamoyl transferase component Bud32
MSQLQERLQASLGDAYRIERELGGGGMSHVFLARETALGRQVVIKVLPPEMSAAVNIERFRREIQLAASLQHPHIVPVHAAAQVGDLFYYTMPLVEGESLRAKLAREGELPVSEAIKILMDVADGLAYAHARGVVHRDIKPDNILISGQHAVVTDFGVAKAVSASTSSSSLTSLGVALGTPAYMAPEQAAADPHVDHRADLYALGAMAYEMLAGRPPFSGMSPQQVLAAHVTTAPAPLSSLRELVPPAMNELVMRLLQKKPADRVQHATEVLSQLQAAATPSGGMAPTGAVPALTSGAEAALKRAQPVRVAMLFALASIAVLAVVFVLRQRLGLPDWVLGGAALLLAIGLPIMLLTGRKERERVMAAATGTHPVPEAGVARHLTWRKAILGGGLSFGALTAIVIGYTLMRVLGIGSVGTLQAKGLIKSRQPILLADFDNRAADSTLGPTLTEALRVDLSQSSTVRLMNAESVSDALKRMQKPANAAITAALGRELAQREGVPALVAGEIDAVGKSYLVSARIVSASTGEVLAAVRESAANDAELIPALDRLSRALRERIGESLVSIRADEPLEHVTTESLDALKKYTEAVRFADADDYDRSIALLQEATALDTGFAMAWRKLAAVLGNTSGSTASVIDATTRAFRHRDRLPELERQATIAYYYNNVDYDEEKTEAAYQAMLAIDPNNDIALNNLGLAYYMVSKFAQSDSLDTRCVKLGFTGTCTWNLIIAQLAEGKESAADSTLRAWEKQTPADPSLMQGKYLLAARKGDYSAAEKYLHELQTAQSSSAMWKEITNQEGAAIAGTQGKLAQSEERYRAAAAAGEQRGLPGEYLNQMAHLAELQIRHRNNPAAAMAMLDSALAKHPLASIEPMDRPYPALASAYALAGRPDEAQRLIAESDRLIPPGVQRGNFLRLGAIADIAAARGDYRGAIAGERTMRTIWGCTNCGLFEIAAAFAKLGQADSARYYYEQLLSHKGPYAVYNDATQQAATYQRLGELYEQAGDRKKAIDYYLKLADLWKNADPELQPVVKDAHARIARLSGEH